MTSQLRLAVHSFPGERPVLLVHGFTSSAQIDWIEPGWPQALAAQGRGTVAVDLPGHGSCPAADRDAISVSAIIAGLVAAIDSTGQDEADVVGYSLGARLAWPLAATGRVRRLVLEALGTSDAWLADMDIELLRAVAKGEAATPDPELAELIAWISQPHLDRDQMLLLMEALAAEPFDAGADLPTVPTLFVSGTEDDPVDQLAATLPNARYLSVPGDHRGALMSAEFRAAALDFLR
jgi:pimeloyl-ACP methyl ester carboxylesterase